MARNSDGPMMNYFYPCQLNKNGNAVAELLEGRSLAVSGPICIVEMYDGETGFALTGGGMDLSWDIATAYVECGFLPPAWIRLPEFGGMTLNAHRRRIIEACKRSAELMAERARWGIGDLERLEKRLRENGKAKKKRA